jgi:HPt (histidine-containing phosphotransfer) domain-containing protein
LVRDLMAVFAESTPERLRLAREAVAAGDFDGAAAAVHSLRSAAGTVGAVRLAELAGELERAARSGGAKALGPGLEELDAEAEEVLREARRLGGAGAGGA